MHERRGTQHGGAKVTPRAARRAGVVAGVLGSVLGGVAWLGGSGGCASGYGREGRAVREPDGAVVRAGGAMEWDATEVERTLDALHMAASKADALTYWSLFAPNAVFIGTDAAERWSLEEFKAYATPYFEKGKGWTYRVTRREVTASADGRVAWFDEALMNEKYGVCRGSGVLVRVEGGAGVGKADGKALGWRIVQYNLSVPIPNDLLPEFAARIREHERGRGRAE